MGSGASSSAAEAIKPRKAAIIVHSGDLDKVMSALILGNGALAMGLETTLFFTFWGLLRLRRGRLARAPLSRLNLLGLGRWLMRRRMHKARVASLERLLTDFKALGGKVVACELTMEVMGLKREDLEERWIDSYGAVGAFIAEAKEAAITLFI
ncbi:MAG: DsrE/DsrF/DrsH-like family protein [Candidatus Acetothermia bacterium]|jgi:peroxiredoxin family protein|nr:DsrE/DsrF/DrsH-like family protein [Candidatus Acetothermia bacterium]MDH7504532.1 DsrE/DsrF/DrsH-like family protein [Candidatus Acetothermia bacterium]